MPMPHPEQPQKLYNLFMRRMSAQSDFTETGVVNSERYGKWGSTPIHGLSTVNYIEVRRCKLDPNLKASSFKF